MKAVYSLTLAITMASVATASWAETNKRKPQQKQKSGYSQRMASSADKNIYGYDYMTGHDRDVYHARMREAKTSQQRAQFMTEHAQRMQERAKAYGVTLPDPALARTTSAQRK